MVKGEQDFNNYQGQKLQLHIKVDDRGNTGGSAEIDEADLLVDVAGVFEVSASCSASVGRALRSKCTSLA